MALEREKALHEEQVGFFHPACASCRSISRVTLVAQYQNPDKVIRIDNGAVPQLHLHEN